MRPIRKLISIFKEFDDIKISPLDYFLILISSIIFSLIIVSGPIAVCLNILILVSNLRLFISFVLAFIFSLFTYFVVYFLLNSISKGKVKGIKSVSLFFGIISMIFGIILVVILIMIGVY